MSDTLRIYSIAHIDIDIARLQAETEKVFCVLLNQKDIGFLNLQFYDNSSVVDDRLPSDGKIYRFMEHKIVESGAFVTYGVDEYWQSHSNVPLYEFCITELPRSRRDPLLIVCLSMTIAVAKMMSVDFVVDYNGIWNQGGSDQISLNDLLGLAITENLELNAAIKNFYDQNNRLFQ